MWGEAILGTEGTKAWLYFYRGVKGENTTEKGRCMALCHLGKKFREGSKIVSVMEFLWRVNKRETDLLFCPRHKSKEQKLSRGLKRV